MKPSNNDLLIRYDESEKKILIYRLLKSDLPPLVIHTEYGLDQLKAKGLTGASRLIGEDILASLEGTRDTIT